MSCICVRHINRQGTAEKLVTQPQLQSGTTILAAGLRSVDYLRMSKTVRSKRAPPLSVAMDVEYVPAPREDVATTDHHRSSRRDTASALASMDESSTDRAVSQRMWASSIISALPSFLFGFCLSALNTALVTGDKGSAAQCFSGEDPTCPPGSVLRDIELPTALQEVATTVLVAGAWLGSMLVSKPSDVLGRRTTLLFNNTLFIGGGIMCAITAGPSGLFVGRFMGGIGVGCGSGVVPVLLSEVSSPRTRGAVCSVHQLMINLGILSSGLFGYFLVQDVEHGWRYLQAFIAVPALAQIALASFVPESPRWLVKRGRVGEAKALMRKLHGGRGGITVEAAIDLEVASMEGNKDDERKGNGSWGELCAHRRPVLIGVTLMLLTAVTGINTVIFYSTTIFELAGVEQQVLATVAVGLSLVVMTSVSGVLIDKAGRRSLLLGGTTMMAVALGSLSVSLFTLSTSPRLQGYLAVGATLLFIAGFSLGMGPVGWIVLAEIVPSRIRAKSFSIFTAINWGSNLFIGLFTLTTIDAMGALLLPNADSERDKQKAGVAGLYAVFAFMCVLAVAFCFVYVKETMGKSLEELNSMDGAGSEGIGGIHSADTALIGHHLGQAEALEGAGHALLGMEGGIGRVDGEARDVEDACRVEL